MYYQSILVSNVFDPMTTNNEELEKLFEELANQKKYKGIETRVIRDKRLRSIFNKLSKEAEWTVTYWVTGEIDRAGLNPSTTDKAVYKETIKELKELVDLAALGNCTYFGIASGKSKGKDYLSEELNQFEKTVRTLVDYLSQYDGMKLVIEPLDGFAHKNGVLGDTETVLNFLERFKNEQFLKNGTLSICWDSAHVALNEDDLSDSIHKLAPYVSRIHYSNAVLDKKHDLYGDNHMKFIKPGFLTPQIAREIIEVFDNSNQKEKDIFVACEIRIKNAEECWPIEKECYEFVQNAIQG